MGASAGSEPVPQRGDPIGELGGQWGFDPESDAREWVDEPKGLGVERLSRERQGERW
jgi:hypothetical protein